MGEDILKGTNYSEGQQVNAANLNAHVDNATIKYTAIASKSLKDPASLSDELLINDDGILKKITLQQISSLLTIPSGTVSDYAGTTAPNGWLMCFGQAVSRVTYEALFDVIGVAFGAGDGSSTFSLPDCRGRVVAGKDNMGGVSANRLTVPLNGDTLGAVGGAETHTTTQAEMAAHQHVGGLHTHNVPAHQHYIAGGAHNHSVTLGGYYLATSITTASTSGAAATYLISPQGSPTFNTSAVGAVGWTEPGYGATVTDSQQGTTDIRGSSAAHNNTQPTIVFNKIIKI